MDTALETPATSSLHTLPHELLAEVLAITIADGTGDVRAVARACATCKAMRDACLADSTWCRLFSAAFAPVLRHCFAGVPPAPPDGDWRLHFISFRRTWIHEARARGYCLLLVRDRLHDVSSFVDKHPGDPMLLWSACGRDATDAFDFVMHPTFAIKMLEGMAVPELDALGRSCVELQHGRGGKAPARQAALSGLLETRHRARQALTDAWRVARSSGTAWWGGGSRSSSSSSSSSSTCSSSSSTCSSSNITTSVASAGSAAVVYVDEDPFLAHARGAGVGSRTM